jgi:thiol-disulfide isomerase/thioredoxin
VTITAQGKRLLLIIKTMQMRIELFFTLIACWCASCLPLHAQTPAPLTIGDKVPPLEITNVVNHPAATIRLSDLKGRLVILDFWSSWCGACISLFPHLQQLQDRFGDSIAIILVNTRSHLSKDNAAKINTILSGVHKRTGTRITLPASFDNPLLDHYFPSIMLPHEVWIGADGSVRAITSSAELNQVNISAVLRGDNINMRQKKDDLGFRSSEPLFVGGNGGDGSSALYRSLLAGYTEGIGIRSGCRITDRGMTGTYVFNQSKLSLVRAAYLNYGTFPRSTTRISSADTHFDINPSAEHATPYLYCYDLSTPPSEQSHLLTCMQEDLKRYFNISVSIQNADEDCLVLTAAGKPASATPRKNDMSVNGETGHNYMYGYRADVIAVMLNRYTASPVICEVADTLSYSVDLPGNMADENALIRAFSGTGLRLRKERRTVALMMITDGTAAAKRLPAAF